MQRNLLAEQNALPPAPAGLEWCFDVDSNSWVALPADEIVEVPVIDSHDAQRAA